MAAVRRGVGVVSLSLDVDDDEDGPSPLSHTVRDNTHEDGNGATTAGPIPEGGIAAPPLPSKNLFSRFFAVSGDMAPMILPPEPEASAKPALSEDLTARLRQQQTALAQRVLVGAPVSSPTTTAVDTAKESRSGAGRKRERTSSVDASSGSASSLSIVVDDGLVPSGFGQDEFLSFSAIKRDTDGLALTAATAPPPTTSPGGTTRGAHDASLQMLRPESMATAVPLWAADRVASEGGYCTENGAVALHQEIMDIVDFLRPTRGEVVMRRLIELEVQSIVQRLWPGADCEVCVYGSMRTHLMLPLSDLDMTVLNVPISTADALTAICREIGKAGLCSEAFPQLILKAKVPLVKYTHKLSGVKVDISVNAGDGRVNSQIVKDLLAKFPEAVYLIMVIKYFLKQRDFDEPYRGGIGSFSTTILVISFLQHHPIYNDERDRRHLYGLGRLLVDFFWYYGCCFNYNRVAVSIADGGFYYDRSRKMVDPNTNRPVQVIIEDPGNEDNNAASSLRTFPSIAVSFEYAYMALTAVFECSSGSELSPDANDVAKRPTLLSRILHVDADMVRGRNVCADGYSRWRASTPKAERQAVATFRFDEDVAMWDPYDTVRHDRSQDP